MTWRVTGVGRVYKDLSDRAQRVQLHQELNKRYGQYFNSPPVGWVFSLFHQAMRPSLA